MFFLEALSQRMRSRAIRLPLSITEDGDVTLDNCATDHIVRWMDQGLLFALRNKTNGE